MRAKEVIELLGLEPLTVEGGFFKEVYRSGVMAADGQRCSGTSIYYLMTEKDVSAWHKVESDEIWAYHGGIPAVQMLVFPDGKFEKRIIGNDLEKGHVPQSIIPAGTWQAATLIEQSDEELWGLFGAAVFPGFEYGDFTGATVEKVVELFPQLEKEITGFLSK
jgi:predicted cupin superfamily sugar epimerase